MGWGRMDDEFDEHPKVLALLDENDEADAAAALAVWVLAFPYAHRNSRRRGRTPGFIPTGLPRRALGSLGRRGAEILVKHRLWDVVEDGWVFHDFADYLPSEKTRQERAEAGRKGAQARWHKNGTAVAPPSQADGNLPSGHSNLPSTDGKPMATDGNAVATDGSHAPARRDPIPVPVTHTQSSRTEDQTLLPRTACAADGEPASPTTPSTDLEPAVPAAPRQRKGTRLPDNWVPSEATREWQRREFAGVDVRTEHLKFTNYWLAKSGRDATKTDWERTWQNWIINAAERAGIRRGTPAQPTATTDGRSIHQKTAAHANHLAAYGED